MEIDIDPDIRKAKTIPSKFYHSLKIYNKLKILFDRSWQFIGDTDLLEKNNAHPGILLEGMVDEPYLLTKDKGNLECLSNVCTHRGNILCNDSCKSKTLVCGYHGRQFEINGKSYEIKDINSLGDLKDNGLKTHWNYNLYGETIRTQSNNPLHKWNDSRLIDKRNNRMRKAFTNTRD
jgi:phenylpropionate dioxygenase-like ring-hydroxylating dioxygenase large terminal subunit